MIQLHHDRLSYGGVTISFQRTLRIPDDGKAYPLPPGLGRFPLRRVNDYADRVPASWVAHGGVFLPMYQREAMWLSFGAAEPTALKVGVGKICAVSGERWSDGLRASAQNYVVAGTQPWLDGIATGHGTVRQFVAMPLGLGYTVEGQVTGEEVHGGIQLQAYPAKPGAIPPPPPRMRSAMPMGAATSMCAPMPCAPQDGEMGIAAGGRMTQKIYPDPHGLKVWDQTAGKRLFVHIVNSMQWREITGEEPPSTPVTAKSYANAGFPWFKLYDEAAPTIAPSDALAGVKSIKAIDAGSSTVPLQDDESIMPAKVHGLPLSVADGEW
ncbi:MAG: hypothetical protein AAF938_17785 [Myxococcota bacterium]